MKIWHWIIVFLHGIFLCDSSRVLELSDKFIDVYKDGSWFVKFYAPWCGHCKRMEPIWGLVAQSLAKTNIRVGRVDCTHFSAACRHFGIASYPTLKFIRGDEHSVYVGDRNKEDLVEYAYRMAGPPVRQITQSDTMSDLKLLNQIYFLYVGETLGPIWTVYESLAGHFQPYSFFYAVKPDLAVEHFDVKETPRILVHKDDADYYFPIVIEDTLSDAAINTSMYRWINEERFYTFHKVTKSTLSELMKTRKLLVMAVVEENKLEQISTDHATFRHLIYQFAHNNRHRYHNTCQFGWISDPSLAHTITMTELHLPQLLVLNSTNQEHHFPEHDVELLTAEIIEQFLHSILNGTAQAFGGRSWYTQLYGVYFETKASLKAMWQGNPVLLCVLFGLPLGFFCLILYSICCSDILDADDEEPLLDHEKRE